MVALDRGWLKNIDEPIFAFFPEYAELRTLEKDRITIRHLLTVSAGFLWDENLPYSNSANSKRPMDEARDLYRYLAATTYELENGH
jgi:CubicO group peptidase (beta-lactamase class C family)